jgi:hypothetical protein
MEGFLNMICNQAHSQCTESLHKKLSCAIGHYKKTWLGMMNPRIKYDKAAKIWAIQGNPFEDKTDIRHCDQ